MSDLERHETNNSGWIVVIGGKAGDHVEVEFEATGYRVLTTVSQIKKGTIKDKMKPSVYGVGYIGDGIYRAKAGGTHTNAYSVWKSMLRRCYSKNALARNPTYKGCSVCIKWRDFQNFGAWFYANYKPGLHIDKDILVKGNRVYSPETCCFITHSENTIEARAKHYKMISPGGEIARIYNMRAFCRKHSLSQSSMSSVSLGKSRCHKGWTAQR